MKPDLMTLTHRESFGLWLTQNNFTGDGVEVGCAFGNFSGRILSTWKGNKLFMVDPWTNLSSDDYPEKHDHVDYEDWYNQCLKISQDDTRATLVRKKSVDAASEFFTASLDFVYLDGAHDYSNVMKDLDAWWPKLKVGGVFSGHDFLWDSPNFLEVAPAVLRWMKEHNQVFTVTSCSSWWTIK